MKAMAVRTSPTPEIAPSSSNGKSANWETFLAGFTTGKTMVEVGTNRNIFSQGGIADCAYYLRTGKVKLFVTSADGKEAILAIVEAGEFFGEGCLVGQQLRGFTACALIDCTLVRLDRAVMITLLDTPSTFSGLLAANLLKRNLRYEEDLVDQLFNTSEKRLARNLLRLARFGKDSKAETVVPKMSQETLSQLVGTTRSRVSHFMNKFRLNGFIEYDNHGELMVHSKLLGVVNDCPNPAWPTDA